MPRGGKRKGAGRPLADHRNEPIQPSDYIRVAIEQPLDGYPNGKAAIEWFTDMSPLERLLAVIHAYNEAHRRHPAADPGERGNHNQQ